MNNNILFESDEQKKATERVLASIRIKSINKDIDELVAEIIKFATNIDTILERNNLEKRYLDKVSELSELDTLTLDPELAEIDFRVKEIVMDLIKRINTRVNLVKNSSDLIEEIESTYDLTEADLDKDIDIAKLNETDFV